MFPMSWLALLARGIDRLNETVGRTVAWLVLAMVLVQFLVVVMRYAFGLGSIWLQESIVYLHALLFMVGALGAVAQVCTIRGLRIAEATAVMPFDYARLLFAGLIGLVVFGEVPGWWSLLGALVIVASTFFVARMEARDYKAESGPSG